MNNQSTVPVWDILIRIFHWSLVVSFIVAYLTSEEENPWHIYSGYTVLGLIIFRLIWGFIGSQYARFSEFARSPAVVYQYVKSLRAGHPQHYLGHNPLGGWMVIAMLLTLFVVTLSGLKVYAIEEGKGPLAGAQQMQLTPIAEAYAEDEDEDEDEEDREQKSTEASKADEEFWEEIHEASSNLMLLLIAFHVFGVILSSRLHRENLIKAMLTGKKNRNH
ncbi:MAG: cytochrome b/b6 domain-containing protein [Methylococcaceae bacterium]|nr:cytochrome b/b6 domain-containing protein [Methylococcaceae bacterium]